MRKLKEIEAKFEVGDKVTIDPTSEYYGADDKYNPAGVVGIILSTTEKTLFEHEYRVQWPLGDNNTNIYRYKDLKLVEKKTIVKEANLIEMIKMSKMSKTKEKCL